MGARVKELFCMYINRKFWRTLTVSDFL